MSAQAHTQSFANFSASAIAITVTPVVERGCTRWLPKKQRDERAMCRLATALGDYAPDGISESQKGQWVSERLDRLFAHNFQNDVFYGPLMDRLTVILVKDEAESAHGLDAAVRRVHASEVIRAARSGQTIPADVASEYESELSTLKAHMPMTS